MAKAKSEYVCSECGAISAKWLGKCPQCGAWNSLTETAVAGGSAQRFEPLAQRSAIVRIDAIDAKDAPRISSGSEEFDRVLGGGLVPGAVILLGGDPGIGKSTLLLQTLTDLSSTVPVLYVTGEESAAQVALRARRLGAENSAMPVLAEINLERILEAIEHSNCVQRAFAVGSRFCGSSPRVCSATNSRSKTTKLHVVSRWSCDERRSISRPPCS
jgi:DNA repair protein RadA/Sms